MYELLELLQQDAHMPVEQLAIMTGKTVAEVADEIQAYQDKKIIAGYTALVDWEKTDREFVSAIIELKITPQCGAGFDAVAEKIAQYAQVKSLRLMSGAYDLAVFVEGKSLKDVALFVSEKLSQTAEVVSTATHFVLKTYKDTGIRFDQKQRDDREVLEL